MFPVPSGADRSWFSATMAAHASSVPLRQCGGTCKRSNPAVVMLVRRWAPATGFKPDLWKSPTGLTKTSSTYCTQPKSQCMRAAMARKARHQGSAYIRSCAEAQFCSLAEDDGPNVKCTARTVRRNELAVQPHDLFDGSCKPRARTASSQQGTAVQAVVDWPAPVRT